MENVPRPLVDALRSAERIAVLTGAGISAESGVPTFRGPEGLWRRYRPEDLATPQAFARDPALVWGMSTSAMKLSVSFVCRL